MTLKSLYLKIIWFLSQMTYSVSWLVSHSWNKLTIWVKLIFWATGTNVWLLVTLLKCLWNEKFFVLIWKAFQNTEEWRFSFWISFFVLEILIDIFLLCNDDVIRFATKKWKILNKRYLWKYWSSVLETWHHKFASKKKRNDTLNAVAIPTISAPVSFCQKTKYPHFQPLKWDRGSYLEQT